DACNHKPSSSNGGSGACFAIPILGKWSDFRLDGGGQSVATALNGKALIAMEVGTLQNFTCVGYSGLNASNSVGINFGFLSQMYQVNNAGCGAIGIQQVGSTSGSVFYRVVVENSGTNALTIAGSGNSTGTPSLVCFYCDLALAPGANNTSVVVNNGDAKFYHSLFLAGNLPTVTNNGITGILGTGTSTLYLDSVSLEM